MKKFFVGLIVALIFPTTILGYSITDPLYAPEKAHLMGDLSFGFTNNDFDLAKSYALYGSLTMGISDKLSLGVGFGWAKIIHESTGFQDLSIKFKYRFLNGLVDDMFLDIDGYVSPEMFHSPWNNEGGSAQGATSLGAIVSVGTLNALDNFNLFAKLGLEHIGHRDTINAGSLLSLRTGAKYYINEKSSFEIDFGIKGYLGFNTDYVGYFFDFSYAYEVYSEHLAFVPYYGAEKRSKDIASTTHWGIKLRYIF